MSKYTPLAFEINLSPEGFVFEIGVDLGASITTLQQPCIVTKSALTAGVGGGRLPMIIHTEQDIFRNPGKVS